MRRVALFQHEPTAPLRWSVSMTCPARAEPDRPPLPDSCDALRSVVVVGPVDEGVIPPGAPPSCVLSIASWAAVSVREEPPPDEPLEVPFPDRWPVLLLRVGVGA